MNLNGDTLIILKNSVMFILINLSKLYILLFCIVTITKVCAEPPKLYKETLNPISYLAYENQAFVEPIPFTDSPIIKINITQPGDKDTQCAVYPSVPDITKTSTYAFINSVEPAQMFSFNNYIYLVDKSLSVSILENTWNSSGASSQLKKVSTIPKPVTIQNRVSEDVTVILSEATGSMQIWTANQVFMYAMSNGGRGLRFLNDRGTGGTGPNTWLKYHINGEFIYIVYKDKTDAVTRFTIAESIEDIFVDETPLFSSLGIEILDFYATDKYIYILEANKGVHVYSLDSTSQPKKLTFIDEPDGKKVLAVDQTLIMITEATKRQYTHFEAVEYIRFEASSDLFTQNNKRRFPGEFVGSISVDDTRVLLLNNNIMFTWYHSIPSQLQPSQDDLLSSYIFYGASGFFIEKFYADNSEFIYTRMQGELQSHKISNKSPQIGCSRSTFQQFSPQTLTLNLVMNSLTCPSKTKSKDNGINSLCVYYQEVTITQASGAAQGRSIFFWILMVFGGLAFSLVIGVMLHYLMKYRSDGAFFRDILGVIGDKVEKLREQGSASPEVIQEMSGMINKLMIVSNIRGESKYQQQIDEEDDEEDGSPVKDSSPPVRIKGLGGTSNLALVPTNFAIDDIVGSAQTVPTEYKIE